MLCHTTMMAFLAGITQPGRPNTVGHVDHETMPIRCHYDDADYIDKCTDLLVYAEDAWLKQVDEIGFEAPIMDTDGILDIYVYNYSSGGAYTYCSVWQDGDSSDDMTGCPAWMGFDRRISDDELASYMAHEFNHVLQYATDFNEMTLPIWEATATAAEQWTYPDKLTPLVGYINDYQAVPWLGLFSDGYFLWHEKNVWSSYEYGAATWILHLDHHYGDGAGSAGAAIWRALAQGGNTNSVDVIDGYEAVTGDWQEAYLWMSAERARIGGDNPPEWLDYGNPRTQVAIDGSYGAKDMPVTHDPITDPFGTGAVYVEVTEAVGDGGLRVDVTGDEGTWGIVAVSDDDILWEKGSTLSWDHPGPVTFGVVNIDHDMVATTGREVHLTDSRREITITITPYSIDDTGGSDTGNNDTTNNGGNNNGGNNGDTDGKEGGGGCSALPLSMAGGWLLLMPVLLSRRNP